MNWKHLILEEALEQIIEASKHRPQLIFKHSTRCSISSMAKDRLERNWNFDHIDPWYLDLLNYRGVSDMIATRFGVKHESPQVLVIVDQEVVHVASHSSISTSKIQAIA